jgi:hypothetical protein
MRGAIPPLPQYVFMVWCLVEYRDNFTSVEQGLLEKLVVVQLLKTFVCMEHECPFPSSQDLITGPYPATLTPV